MPPTVTTQIQTQIQTLKPPPRRLTHGPWTQFEVRRRAKTRFVVNELVLHFTPIATVQMRNALAKQLCN